MSAHADHTLARLILADGERMLSSIALDKPAFSIGRNPDNAIALDHLTVSAEHAVLEFEAGRARLRDLRSRNGTLVNGERIVECWLAHGDLIEVGVFRLRFILDAAITEPDEPAPIISEAPRVSPSADARLEYLAGAPPYRVLLIDRPIVALHAGEVVTVVSRRRAGHVITHLEGGAFARLNGIPIGLEPRPLADGDLIDLAGVLVRFRDTPDAGTPV
jgi:pSer/pThr/pTyr-binding forkhead associated (FHA) protein